jgi:hypothetical protein
MAAVSAPVTLSPENQVEFATLARMLELASGFTLAFVRVNHASLRDRLVEELLARFPQRTFFASTLRPPLEDGTVVHGVVTQLLDAVGERSSGRDIRLRAGCDVRSGGAGFTGARHLESEPQLPGQAFLLSGGFLDR